MRSYASNSPNRPESFRIVSVSSPEEGSEIVKKRIDSAGGVVAAPSKVLLYGTIIYGLYHFDDVHRISIGPVGYTECAGSCERKSKDDTRRR
jgi:hypothetical protein